MCAGKRVSSTVSSTTGDDGSLDFFIYGIISEFWLGLSGQSGISPYPHSVSFKMKLWFIYFDSFLLIISMQAIKLCNCLNQVCQTHLGPQPGSRLWDPWLARSSPGHGGSLQVVHIGRCSLCAGGKTLQCLPPQPRCQNSHLCSCLP